LRFLLPLSPVRRNDMETISFITSNSYLYEYCSIYFVEGQEEWILDSKTLAIYLSSAVAADSLFGIGPVTSCSLPFHGQVNFKK